MDSPGGEPHTEPHEPRATACYALIHTDTDGRRETTLRAGESP